MTPTTIPALIGASILILAITFFLLMRSRRRSRAVAYGAAQTGALIEILRDALHFMMGPLPLSISLHAAVLLGLLWGVHIEQGRELIMVYLQAGRGGGGVRRLVRITGIAIVVSGSSSHTIQVVQMTVSIDKLIYLLNSIQTHNGGEWQKDTLGAVRTAIDRMGWTTAAKKIIVLVGDTPPFDEDAEPVLEEVRKFRMEDGTFNTVDVTVEEHERFVEDWNLHNFGNLSSKGPLPTFYLQTQNACRTIASPRNGSCHSLTKEQQIHQQELRPAFGEEWRREGATFGRGITSPSPDP